MMESKELLERLAKLEHEQWMDWSKSIAKELHIVSNHIFRGENAAAQDKLIAILARWQVNWKPYEKVSEGYKAFDRDYAKKVLKALEEGDA